MDQPQQDASRACIGGALLTILALFVVGSRRLERHVDVSSWHLFWLGVVIAVIAPLGDLTESMFKRNLDMKDFGTIVQGHGGVLDRFDGFLFTLPAVYYLTTRARALDRRPRAERRATWTPVRVAIAGSSGSIGTQTLDVVRAEAATATRSSALGVGSSVDDADRAGRRVPARASSPSPTRPAGPRSPRRCRSPTVVDDLADLVEPADVVVNGVVGFAGLPVTIATLRGRQAARRSPTRRA